MSALSNWFNHLSPTTRGVLLLCVSSSLFATMGVCIRFASFTVDNTQVVFFRNIVTLVVIGGIYLGRAPKRFFKDMKTTQIKLHLARGITGVAAMYGFFYAIAKLPLSNAMIFTYAAPVFIPFVAWVFLREPMSARMWLAAALGFVGVTLVAKPDTGVFDWISVIGLSAALLAATAFVAVRALTKTEPITRIVFYFALIASVISFVPAIPGFRAFSLTELGFLIGAGVFATAAQMIMSKAYSYADAGKIAPANYTAIAIAGGWAWLIWGEVPDLISMTGMLVILGAILLCMPESVRTFKAWLSDKLAKKT